MEITKAISAILFYQAEPMSIRRLSSVLKRTEDEIREALPLLASKLSAVGLELVHNENEVTLATAPEASALIESITKEELSKDLSKAALETLAIVLYKGPITRSEIDYIRGVNSTFILRNLLVRGLVAKVENPSDQRSFLYTSTFQLLEYMGIGKTEDLPDFHDAIVALGAFVDTKQAEEKVEAAASVTGVEDEKSGDAGAVADLMDEAANELDLEADLAEEDETGENFNDETISAHTDSDRKEELEKLPT